MAIRKDENWEKQETTMNIWLPKNINDTLTGKVVETKEGQYGKQWLIDTGTEQVWSPSHKVLQNRMSNIMVGDTVMLQFTAVEPPSVKGQNPMKMYEVYRKK